MLHRPGISVYFFVFALGLALLSPLIILLVPITVIDTLYFSKENIVIITPIKNFVLITIAMLLVIAGIVILGFKRNILTYSIVVILLIASAVSFYLSTISYTAIQQSQIVMKNGHTAEIFPWHDLQEVVYEYETNSPGTYYFKTKNHQEFMIQENGQFNSEKKQTIYRVAKNNGIHFIERPKHGE